MLSQTTTNKFDRDVIKQVKRGKNIEKLIDVMTLITQEMPLAKRHRDHPLAGHWAGYRDCHVEPDWVLIYKIDGSEVLFARTGTHTDLFG
jgi:mRNA interferase YafQ